MSQEAAKELVNIRNKPKVLNTGLNKNDDLAFLVREFFESPANSGQFKIRIKDISALTINAAFWDEISQADDLDSISGKIVCTFVTNGTDGKFKVPMAAVDLPKGGDTYLVVWKTTGNGIPMEKFKFRVEPSGVVA